MSGRTPVLCVGAAYRCATWNRPPNRASPLGDRASATSRSRRRRRLVHEARKIGRGGALFLCLAVEVSTAAAFSPQSPRQALKDTRVVRAMQVCRVRHFPRRCAGAPGACSRPAGGWSRLAAHHDGEPRVPRRAASPPSPRPLASCEEHVIEWSSRRKSPTVHPGPSTTATSSGGNTLPMRSARKPP